MASVCYIVNEAWYFRLHWLERAIHASNQGWKVYVVISGVDSDVQKLKEECPSEIEVIRVNIDRTGMNFFREASSLFSLLKVLKEISPDVLHLATIKPIFYVSIVSFLISIPIVATFPGLGTLKSSNKLRYIVAREFILRVLFALLSKQKAIYLFENERDLNYCRKYSNKDFSRFFRVFGAGVDTEIFKPLPPKNVYTKVKVLFASRLLKAKGLEVIAKAVKELQKDSNIELLVAGIFDHASPLAYTREEIDDLQRRFRFEWLGSVTDMPKLLSEVDIVALPTNYGEGIPRILIEAAACGIPTIATDVGGCPDICIDGFTGFIVESNSISNIKERLSYLIDCPDVRVRFGRNARQVVIEKFSNRNIFIQNIDFYHKLIQK